MTLQEIIHCGEIICEIERGLEISYEDVKWQLYICFKTTVKTVLRRRNTQPVLLKFERLFTELRGPRWRSGWRHCATSRKVAVSIPDGVIGIFHWHNLFGRSMALRLTQPLTCMSIVRLKCDGTRAETRFPLSLKRTSPFKSAGASVQSTAGSRGVRISGSNAG